MEGGEKQLLLKTALQAAPEQSGSSLKRIGNPKTFLIRQEFIDVGSHEAHFNSALVLCVSLAYLFLSSICFSITLFFSFIFS